MNYKILILTLVCLLFAGGLILNSTTGLFGLTNNNTIKIGIVFPLTGELSMYGASSKAALEYASEKINYEINGKKIQYIFEDGKCDGKEATIAFNKLVNVDKVNYIIGGLCSSETMVAKEALKGTNAIVLSPCATTPALKNTNNIFTVKPLDDLEGKYDAEYIYNNLNRKNIAILACENDWCKGIEKTFSERYNQLGGNILTIEKNNNKETDFATTLAKIKILNPELIVVFEYPEAFENIIMQSKQLDLNIKMYIPIFLTKDLVDKYTSELQGSYGIREANILNDSNLENEIKTRTNMMKVDVDYCASTTYDTLMILKNAIEKANSFDTEKVKKSLLKNDYSGILGLHRFDEYGNQAIANFKVFEVKGKELVDIN